MPRYEKLSGKKRLFWEIAAEGAVIRIRTGEVGAEAKAKTEKKKLDYAYQAGMEMRRLIQAQEKKKFVRVREEIPPDPGTRNEELEAALREEPDNTDAALVYGDWLQAQGDPRGELIAAQHALALAPRRKSLVDEVLRLRAPYDAQLRALVERHDLSGHDAKRGRLQVVWGLGFMRSARLAHDYFATDLGDADLGETLSAFLALPSARLLQELTIGLWRDADGQCEYGDVAEVLARVRPPALRKLHLADFEYPSETEISWTELGDLEPLWAVLPRLRELVLQGGGAALGAIRAPSLRSFELRTGGLAAASARAIAAAEWPELERLVVWFGDPQYGGDAGLDEIQPLLGRRDLPRLRHLGLMNARFEDDLCRALASSALAPQIEVLDLSLGMMSDAGAEALAAARPRLGRLRELRVGQNYLGEGARRALRGLCPKLDFGEQKTPYVWQDGSEHRYVSVSE